MPVQKNRPEPVTFTNPEEPTENEPTREEPADAPSQNDTSNSRDTREVTREVAPSGVVKQDLPEHSNKEDEKPQSYVHLANGTVLRCNDEDLPLAAGAGAPLGFWQQGNSVHTVTGVYPVETVVEEKR